VGENVLAEGDTSAVAVSEYPGLRRVRPGLYESTEDVRGAEITPEFAREVRKHATSAAAQEFLDALMSARAGRSPRRRLMGMARAALVGLVSGLAGLGAAWIVQAIVLGLMKRGGP